MCILSASMKPIMPVLLLKCLYVILMASGFQFGQATPRKLRSHVYFSHHYRYTLTHWRRDKMNAISQTTFYKCILLNENVCITTKNSLKFVPKGPINNIPALVQIMAWRRPGDKPLSEPMLVCLPTHICVTRPQWVNTIPIKRYPMNSLAPGRCCSNVESKISEHLWRALFRRLSCK